MSKKFNVTAVTQALDDLTGACQSYASAGAAVTATLCAAMAAGANVTECVDAAQCGFELGSQDMPQGFESNLKRLHAAGAKYWRAAADSGLSLNNRLLQAIECPKVAKQGRKPGAKTQTANGVSTAAVDPINPAPIEAPSDLHRVLRTLRDVNATFRSAKGPKGNTLDAAATARLADILSEACALLAMQPDMK